MVERKVKSCYAVIELDSTRNISSASLRGFLGYLFVNDPEFHHHSESSFHYPLVQYKKVEKKLLVMGLNDYAAIVFKKISQLKSIVVPDEKIRVKNVDLSMSTTAVIMQNTRYGFLSPWLALNEDNYAKFKTLDRNYRKEFLEKILVGNILSTLKGLGIFVDFKISADIQNFRSVPTFAHNNKFQGFYVNFNSNIYLPRYIGIGKSVSKGFGVLELLR